MKLTKRLLTFASFCLLALAQAPAQPRMLCFYLDLNSLDAAGLAAAQDQAARFIETQTDASDRIAVMTYGSGFNVVQDFTGDRDKLVTALRAIVPQTPASADASARLQAIQAAMALEPLPQKKTMIYFSAGVPGGGQADLRAAIDALVKANVSIFPVDARGVH